jgi:hypothetical protein
MKEVSGIQFLIETVLISSTGRLALAICFST